MFSSAVHLLNMKLISVTFDVSQELKSSSLSAEQLENNEFIFVTFAVLTPDKLTDCNEVQP